MATQMKAAPGLTMAPEDQLNFFRRQQAIDALTSQRVPDGRMLGNVFVAPTPFEAIAKTAAPMIGRYQQAGLDGEVTRATAAYRQQQNDALQRNMTPGVDGTVPREQAIQMLMSQDPRQQALGSSEYSRIQSENTPLMRLLKPMLGQPGPGAVGGVQIPGGGMPPPMPGNAPPLGSGPDAPMAGPSPTPQPGGAPSGLAQMFPNLQPQEIMIELMSDPSGKGLASLNAKRNAPIVAGNNVFNPSGGGRVVNAPGSVEAMAAVEEAKARAQAQFAAPIEIPTSQGVQYVPRNLIPQMGNPQSAPPTPAPTGRDPMFTVPPGVQSGRDQESRRIIADELASARDPAVRAALERELSRLPQGAPAPVAAPRSNLPGFNSGYSPAKEAGQTELLKGDAKTVESYREGAQKAGESLQALGTIRQAITSGAFQGSTADIKTRVAGLATDLGIPVNQKQLANSQTVQAMMQALVMPLAKQLGVNPTDADAKRIDAAMGSLQNNPESFNTILGILESKANKSITRSKAADDYFRANQSLGGFDYRDAPAPMNAPARAPAPAAAPSQPISLEDYLKQKGGR